MDDNNKSTDQQAIEQATNRLLGALAGMRHRGNTPGHIVMRVSAARRKAAGAVAADTLAAGAAASALADLVAACTDSNSTWSRTRTPQRAWRAYASALDAARQALWQSLRGQGGAQGGGATSEAGRG